MRGTCPPLALSGHSLVHCTCLLLTQSGHLFFTLAAIVRRCGGGLPLVFLFLWPWRFGCWPYFWCLAIRYRGYLTDRDVRFLPLSGHLAPTLSVIV